MNETLALQARVSRITALISPHIFSGSALQLGDLDCGAQLDLPENLVELPVLGRDAPRAGELGKLGKAIERVAAVDNAAFQLIEAIEQIRAALPGAAAQPGRGILDLLERQ